MVEVYICLNTQSLLYQLILYNLSVLNSADSHIILRCPIIQGINDREEHFEEIARLANKYQSIKSVEFMPYHPLGIPKSEQIGKICVFTKKDFMDKKIIEKYCENIRKITNISIKIN